jgi:phosphatidate cytidylyltransferase
LKIRIISAVVLLPIVLALIVWGGWPFFLLVSGVFLLAGWEYVRMLGSKEYELSQLLVWAGTVLWMVEARCGGDWLGPGLAVLALLSAARQVLYRRVPAPTASWALSLAGGLYLGVGAAYLLRLRALPDGLWWVFTAYPTIWIADTGAYVAGRLWGRHKIAPQISPGKSWEGYVGELITGGGAGLFFGFLWPQVARGTPGVTPIGGAILGVLLAALTPMGDFFISMIKREVGVKDTSGLIPGHGGILDRLDSLIWTNVLTWLFVAWW